MSAIGRVLGVAKRRQGCAVSSTVTGDNTTKLIPVDSFVVDLDEDGGQFKHQPTGDVYTYASCDKDAETLTLSAGLPTGKTLTAGDALYVEPAANDFYADLAIDDVAEDTVSARVPQGLRTILEEGVRQRKKGPLVRAEPGDEEWEITELVGEEPIIQDTTIEQGGNPFLRANGVPRVKVDFNGGTTTAGTTVTVSWDSEQVDTDGMWASGNPSRIEPAFKGQWKVSCSITWADASAGNRQIWMEQSTDSGANWSVLAHCRDGRSAISGDVTPTHFSHDVGVAVGNWYRIRRLAVGASPDATTGKWSWNYLGQDDL